MTNDGEGTSGVSLTAVLLLFFLLKNGTENRHRPPPQANSAPQAKLAPCPLHGTNTPLNPPLKLGMAWTSHSWPPISMYLRQKGGGCSPSLLRGAYMPSWPGQDGMPPGLGGGGRIALHWTVCRSCAQCSGVSRQPYPVGCKLTIFFDIVPIVYPPSVMTLWGAGSGRDTGFLRERTGGGGGCRGPPFESGRGGGAGRATFSLLNFFLNKLKLLWFR